MFMIGGVAALGATAVIMANKDDDKNDEVPFVVPDPVVPPEEEAIAAFETDEYKLSRTLTAINASTRYAQGATGAGVKVAILDTGVDIDNIEFAGRIDTASSYSYIDGGYQDQQGHGTHVAGIVGAAKNDDGTHGVAFDATLMILKGIPGASGEVVNQSNVWGDSSRRAADANAAIINNSWTYSTKDADDNSIAIFVTDFNDANEVESFLGTQAIRDLRYAADRDLLSVTAAGNDGASEVSIVAGIPLFFDDLEGYHIAVASTDNNGYVSFFTNRCGVAMNWCISAPGNSVQSTAIGGGVTYKSGTSMAAPLVAGAAAVIKSQSPELTAPQISQILFETATDLGDPGVDEIFGHGMLNLDNAQSPQGDLTLYQSTHIDGPKTSLANSGIRASAALGTALTTALSGQTLMVGDKYDRAFYLDADALVQTSTTALPSVTAQEETLYSMGGGMAMISGTDVLGVQYNGADGAYHFAQGNAFADTENMTPLAYMEADYTAGYKVNISPALSMSTSLAAANGEADALGTSLSLKASMGEQGSFTASVGRLDESGTVLGSAFLGASGGNGQATTSFVQIATKIALAEGTSLTMSGTTSNTSFDQDGIINRGKNLMGSSGKVAIARDGFLGTKGRFTASVSSPLQVTSGTLDVNMPQTRAASVDGVISTAVGMSQTSIDFEAPVRPYDIAFSYAVDTTTTGLNTAINAGYRAQGDLSTPFMGIEISKRF
jgi:subtilisin family serine protease